MWQKIDSSLYNKFEFSSFDRAIDFINMIADIAVSLDHHPIIRNDYDKVEIWLTTHSEGGKVTKKDEEFALKIDEIIKEKPDKITGMTKKAKLFTDGGSRGNPGESAIGYVLFDEREKLLEKTGRYIGIKTNNQAEYLGLKEGLLAAKERGVSELDVFMDSLLVVNQLKGLYKVKNQELAPLHKEILNLAKGFKSIGFNHVPREQNKVADGLVNQALDNH